MGKVIPLPAKKKSKHMDQIRKNMSILADVLLKNGSPNSSTYREGFISSLVVRLFKMHGIKIRYRPPYLPGSVYADAWNAGYERGEKELRIMNERGILTERLFHPE